MSIVSFKARETESSTSFESVFRWNVLALTAEFWCRRNCARYFVFFAPANVLMPMNVEAFVAFSSCVAPMVACNVLKVVPRGILSVVSAIPRACYDVKFDGLLIIGGPSALFARYSACSLSRSRLRT